MPSTDDNTVDALVTPVPPSTRKALVALVGLRPRAEAAFREAVEGDPDFTMAVFPDLAVARLALEARAEPAVILVCEAALLDKRLDLPRNMTLWAVSGPERTSPKELGVDQIVSRPLDPDDLRARLVIAARALTAGAQRSPFDVLTQALADSTSGEVVIHRGTDFCRILLKEGSVGWVHRSGRRTSVRDLLASCGVIVDEAAVREVLEECRRSRRHFGDVLVEWDIVKPEILREALRKHLEVMLREVLEWEEATAFVVHDDRPATGALTFAASEVMPDLPRRHRLYTRQGLTPITERPTDRDDPAVLSWLERVSVLPHVLGCALLDPRTGTVLGHRGSQDMADNLVWGLVAAFTALGPGREELLATLKDTAYLVRSGAPRIRAVAVVAFDPRDISLAMARIMITKAETQ